MQSTSEERLSARVWSSPKMLMTSKAGEEKEEDDEKDKRVRRRRGVPPALTLPRTSISHHASLYKALCGVAWGGNPISRLNWSTTCEQKQNLGARCMPTNDVKAIILYT